MTHYWTWSFDGKRRDLECESQAEVYKHACGWWEGVKANDDESDGELDIELIKFHFNDEGEMVDDKIIKTVV